MKEKITNSNRKVARGLVRRFSRLANACHSRILSREHELRMILFNKFYFSLVSDQMSNQ